MKRAFKNILGILLVASSFIVLLSIAFPQLYNSSSSGKVEKSIETNFSFLKKENAEIIILYAGYVGCTYVCLPALQQINEIYQNLKNKNKVSVYFIDLLENSSKDQVSSFAKYFNKNFNGISLNQIEKKEFLNTLRLNYSNSLSDTYEVNHSSFLYILEKKQNKYTQKYIYTTRPFDIKTISNDLDSLFNL